MAVGSGLVGFADVASVVAARLSCVADAAGIAESSSGGSESGRPSLLSREVSELLKRWKQESYSLSPESARECSSIASAVD